MAAHVPTLETPRLWLRKLGEGDIPQVQAVFPRWEIVQYLSTGVPWPYPPDGAAKFINGRVIPAMEAGDQWAWSLRPKSDPGELIGVISLMRDREDENRGFWLIPEWQGRGLMTEACIAVTDFWFVTLGNAVLRVPKAIANERSRRISRHMGMRVVGLREQDYVSGRLQTEIWEITRKEWRLWRARENRETG